MLSFKTKKCAKNMCVCLMRLCDYCKYNENEAEKKNASHRYDINSTRSRHTNILNTKCVSLR